MAGSVSDRLGLNDYLRSDKSERMISNERKNRKVLDVDHEIPNLGLGRDFTGTGGCVLCARVRRSYAPQL